MHMSDSKDETLFFDQILLLSTAAFAMCSCFSAVLSLEFMIMSQGRLQTTGEV